MSYVKRSLHHLVRDTCDVGPYFGPCLFLLHHGAVLVGAIPIWATVVAVDTIRGFVLAAFDEAVALRKKLAQDMGHGSSFLSNLQSVLSRKALATKVAGERLDGQVDPLVSLEVVVPAERLNALVTLERAFVLWWTLLVAVHDLMRRSVTLGNAHVGEHRHLRTRLMDVCHNGTSHVGECRV
jgi:hypothetical protein